MSQIFDMIIKAIESRWTGEITIKFYLGDIMSLGEFTPIKVKKDKIDG